MLPSQVRLRRSTVFAAVTKRGKRVRRGHLVVYYDITPAVLPSVGFIVGRPIGNAVKRHQVARRLRHACLPLIPTLPPGAVLIVRALPGAGEDSYAVLSRDLHTALTRLTGHTAGMAKEQKGAS